MGNDEDKRNELYQSLDINETIFSQILDMDDNDDETREFSRNMVFEFLRQASTSFPKMDDLIGSLTNNQHPETFQEMSNLSNYLKNTSTTLGFDFITGKYEKLEWFSSGRDENGNPATFDAKLAVKLLAHTTSEAKQEFNMAAPQLEHFYGAQYEQY